MNLVEEEEQAADGGHVHGVDRFYHQSHLPDFRVEGSGFMVEG